MGLVTLEVDGIKKGGVNFKATQITVDEDSKARANDLVSAAYDLGNRCDELEKSGAELQAKFDAQAKESGDQKIKLDELEKAGPMAIKEAAKSWREAEKVAEFFNVDKIDSFTDIDELKKATILKNDSSLKLDEKHEAYVQVAFDMLADKAKSGEKGHDELAELAKLNRNDRFDKPKGKDGDDDENLSAREKFAKRNGVGASKNKPKAA